MSGQLPEKPGPVAPGKTKPGPFGTAKWAVVNVEGAQAATSWARLTRALGVNLQGGMHRAHQATRRMAKAG